MFYGPDKFLQFVGVADSRLHCVRASRVGNHTVAFSGLESIAQVFPILVIGFELVDTFSRAVLEANLSGHRVEPLRNGDGVAGVNVGHHGDLLLYFGYHLFFIYCE